MELSNQVYQPYLSLLEKIFIDNDNIIEHSKAVAKLTSRICDEINVHLEIKERAIKLAILHDIGKLKWLSEREKGNIIDDYKAGQYILSQINNSTSDIEYIFYLKKYLDYTFLNSASIMSFPIETLIVCYADLQVIENKIVSIDERKNYVYKRYFKTTSRESEFGEFWLQRINFFRRFEDYLSERNPNSKKNYYQLLALNTGGWLYGEEYSFLQELSRIAITTKKDFVEVGSWRGKSAILLAGVLKENSSTNILYCVDDWKGGTDLDCLRLAKSVDIFYEFQNNTKNLSEYIIPIKGLSTDESTLEKLPNKIGLIFLDGAHDYDTVKKEISLYRNRIANHGIICFHDTDNPNYPGVRKAFEEFLDNNEFKFIGQKSYIAAFQKTI